MMNARNKGDNLEINKVFKVFESKILTSHIRHRLYTLKMNYLLSEEDVLHHVVLCLVETLQSGKAVPYPVAWAKVVAQRYIKSQYEKYKGLAILESERIEYFENSRNSQTSDSLQEEEIHGKIQQLKPERQKILLWRFFENYSWEKIAELLSQEEGKTISSPSARKRGERALNELRKKYM